MRETLEANQREARFLREKGLYWGSAVCLLALFVRLRAWNQNPRIPASYSGDALFTLSSLANMKENFWYFNTAHLGFPFGQDLRDFPMIGDTGNYLVLRLLLTVTNDIGATFNLFYFGSFVAIFVATFVSSRRLQCSQATAFLVASAYTFAPFHFGHNSGHLFLSNYAMVPIWISAVVIECRSSVSQIQDGETIVRLRSSIFYWSVIPAAFFGTYFATFFLLTGVFGLLLCKFRYRQPARRLVVSVSSVIALLSLQALPSIIYQVRHGSNLGLTSRSFGQLDFYALRPLRMLLPGPTHILTPIRNWINSRPAEFLQGENIHQLGLLASLGLVVVGGGFLLDRFKRARSTTPLGIVLSLTVFLVVCGVVGGLSSAFGLLGLTEVRVWDRIAIPIGFCGLVLCGYTIDTSRLKSSKQIVVFVLALFAIAEQVPFNATPNYRSIEEAWRDDMFAGQVIRTSFAEDAKIFQVPIAEFPESPTIVGMTDYEHLRPRLHADSAFFSYGGLRGRGSRWFARLSPDITSQIREIASLGFDALWVDRRGIADQGAEIKSTMTREFGLRPIKLRQDSVYLFDLRQILTRKDRTELWMTKSKAILDPLFFEIKGASGFDAEGRRVVDANKEDLKISVTNVSNRPVIGEVQFSASAKPTVGNEGVKCRTDQSRSEQFETRCEVTVKQSGLTLFIRYPRESESQLTKPIIIFDIKVESLER